MTAAPAAARPAARKPAADKHTPDPAPVHPAWPHDKRAELDAFYGRPGDTHALVAVPVPWHMTYEGQPVSTIRIHKRCAESLKRILAAIWAGCGRDQVRLEKTGLHLYGGSFAFRFVRGAHTYSCHAYGAAIDFDPAHNAMHTKGHMDPLVIAAFKAEGAFWGGDFKSRTDPMHFQFTTGA